MRIERIGLSLVVIFMVGCSPSSLEDLRCEAAVEARKLTAELERIETRDDLEKALPRLKKHFNRIGRIVKEVKQCEELKAMEPTLWGEKLFIEMARLYEMPGARELIESAQVEAVYFLR